MLNWWLVGFSRGDIDTVEISGVSEIKGVAHVGGLVGIAEEGHLRKTSATLNVSELHGNGGKIGGLVGFLQGMGCFITNSYFRGAVNAPNSENVGGLVGTSRGGISLSYAVSDVFGNSNVGTFIGDTRFGGKDRIVLSFASPINDESPTGNFVGTNTPDSFRAVKFAVIDPLNDH